MNEDYLIFKFSESLCKSHPLRFFQFNNQQRELNNNEWQKFRSNLAPFVIRKIESDFRQQSHFMLGGNIGEREKTTTFARLTQPADVCHEEKCKLYALYIYLVLFFSPNPPLLLLLL